MHIELSTKEFRRLLDMVYIGNWILNSTRGDNRFADYDDLESKLFALCRTNGMDALTRDWNGTVIALYEDNVFYEILAEELARRDMGYAEVNSDNYDELISRMERYMQEFQLTGVDRLVMED